MGAVLQPVSSWCPSAQGTVQPSLERELITFKEDHWRLRIGLEAFPGASLAPPHCSEPLCLSALSLLPVAVQCTLTPPLGAC